VGVFLALWTWLFAVWPIDDSRAALMTARDWQLAAAFIAADAFVTALLVSAGLFALNWLAARFAGARLGRWAPGLALAAGAVILLAGVAGAIQFLIQKPWF
jgi:hypothetical protein